MSDLSIAPPGEHQRPNPFMKAQINNAWEKPKDVGKIHMDVTQRLLQTVTQIADMGSVMQALVGAAGSGKTHLLARLWQLSIRRKDFLFVAIPPPGDVRKVNRHILREIVASLLTEVDQELRPIERLITEVMRKVLLLTVTDETLRNNVLNSKPEALFKLLSEGKNRTAFVQLSLGNFSKAFPNTDVQLAQGLFAFLDPFRKAYALKWFQGGELTQEELTNLGIGTAQIDEDMAMNMSRAILRISPYPVLLAADQLESTFYRSGKEGLLILVDSLVGLLQDEKNLFLVLLAQTQEWVENIRNNLPRYILDRISRLMTLKPLSIDETFLLVNTRLEVFHRTTETIFLQQKEFYPFSRDFITQVHQKAGGNPRKILNLLRDAFDFAQARTFDPSWEYAFASEGEVSEKNTPQEIVQAALSQLTERYKKEVQRKALEIDSFSDEKLQEISKGFYEQILVELVQTLVPREDSKILLDQEYDSLRFDLFLEASLWEKPIGILYLSQKNPTQLLTSLQNILTVARSQKCKIVIIRPEHASGVDQAPTVKPLIEEVQAEPEIEFYYLNSDHEVQLLANKNLLDDAKDLELDIITDSTLVLWYLLSHQVLTSQGPIQNLFTQTQIQTVRDHLSKRIFRLALVSKAQLQDKAGKWERELDIANTTLISAGQTEVSCLELVAYEGVDDLRWFLYSGDPHLTLVELLDLLAQHIPNLDVKSTFVKNNCGYDITHLIEYPIGEVKAEHGHGILFTPHINSEVDIEGATLGYIHLAQEIFSQIPPQKSLTAEKLSNSSPVGEVPVKLLVSLAQMWGEFLEVRFSGGTFTSTKQVAHEITEPSVIPVEDGRMVNASQALDIAEERGDVQRVWDDNVIELTSRLKGFNLYIESTDYDLLSALLNYAKISPDKLTPIIKGLVKQQQSKTQRKGLGESETGQKRVDLEDIQEQILSSYQPFKEDWEGLRRLPNTIGALGRAMHTQSYTLNAFTLLDFESGDLSTNWHIIITGAARSFVQTNIMIQQLSSTYYTQRFEENALKPLVPIVNRYQFLTKVESEKLRTLPEGSEERQREFLTLTRHMAEWWMIVETYNKVVGQQYHLESGQLLEELFQNFVPELGPTPPNFISHDHFTFRTVLHDAFRFAGEETSLLTQLQDQLGELVSDTYSQLALQRGHVVGGTDGQDLFFWYQFYQTFRLDPSSALGHTTKVLSSNWQVKQGAEGTFQTILKKLQIILPLLSYNAQTLESGHPIIFMLGLIYSEAIALLEQDTKEGNEVGEFFDFLLLSGYYPSENNLYQSMDQNYWKPLLTIPQTLFESIGRGRVRYIESYNSVFGCYLTYDNATALVRHVMESLGITLKEEKETKRGVRYVFRGKALYPKSEENTSKLELTIQVSPIEESAVITIEQRWSDSSPEVTYLSKVITSYLTTAVVTTPSYRQEVDRQFVVNCLNCSFQINLLKEKSYPYQYWCKNCGVSNILHPLVYVPVRKFMGKRE